MGLLESMQRFAQKVYCKTRCEVARHTYFIHNHVDISDAPIQHRPYPPYKQYRELFPDSSLKKSEVLLKTYLGECLPVVGEITVRVQHNQQLSSGLDTNSGGQKWS